MDRLIEVKVGGSHLWKDSRVAGVRGEGNVNRLRITFDEIWDGYAKKVTFWDAKGKNPVERTLTVDLLENLAESTRIYICPIPGEPMAEAGMMTFAIDGYLDGRRSRTLSTELEVEYAPIADNAGEPVDPTPTQAEQLQVEIEKITDDLQATAKAANTIMGMTVSSETVDPDMEASVEKQLDGDNLNLHFSLPRGAEGPQGQTGPKGDTGDTGPQGPQGPQGLKGDPGSGFRVLGYYASLSALESAVPSPNAGDAYGVGTTDPYDIYIYGGSSGWVNNGPLQGAKGDTGPQGPQGEKGDKGDKGPQGEKGEKGDKGDKGDTGATGPQGPRGEQGPQGPAGEGKGDMMASVYDPAGLKKDIFRYVGDMTSDALTSAYAYADELLENAQVSSGGGVLECYLDQTEFWEVNDAYQNGSTVVMWDNNELWPLVYANTDNEYRFQSVSPDGIRTAYLTEEGWSNGYDEFGSGGVSMGDVEEYVSGVVGDIDSLLDDINGEVV